MDEVINTVPESVQNGELEEDESLNEVVSEFFGIVGGARLEEDVRLDLHLPTGDIIDRHTDEDTVARISFEDGVSAMEISRDDFLSINRSELETVSRPTTQTNVIHD